MIDKKVIISIAVLLAFIVGTCFLIKIIFSGKGESSNHNQYWIDQAIAARDSVIAAKNERIADKERLIEEKEKTNEALQSRDSVLNVHYNETEKLYNNINAKIKDIPNRISRIATNNDSLRRALSGY